MRGFTGRESLIEQKNTEYTFVPLKREYVFGFAFILALFYVNQAIVRYVFGLYLLYVLVRSVSLKMFFPDNQILRGVWVFSAGILISVIFSPYPKVCFAELRYLAAGLGAVTMYLDISKGRCDKGRPPLVWPEIGGMWLAGALIAGYFFQWTPPGSRYKPFLRATSISCGYAGLMVSSFVAVNLLTALYQRKRSRPSPGYALFLGIYAPLLAARLSYYLQQKELIEDRLSPTLSLIVLFWSISLLWYISVKTRIILQLLTVAAGGFIAYLSWARSSYFPYFILLFISGNMAVLMKWSKRRVLLAAACSCLILICSTLGLYMFFSGRTRDEFAEGDSKIAQAVYLNKRKDIYETSWEVFKRYPLTGTGFNKQSYVKVFADVHPEGKEVGHSHNLFLQILVTQGIIGFACFLFLCYSLMSQLVVHVSSGRAFCAVFFLPVLMMLISGLFHHPLISYRFLSGFFSFGIAAAGLSMARMSGSGSEDKGTFPIDDNGK